MKNQASNVRQAEEIRTHAFINPTPPKKRGVFISSHVNNILMQLNLSVDGQLLATVPVDPEKWKDKNYRNILTRLLTTKNQRVIRKLRKPPTFYLQVASKINQPRN
jgi:hypothetical protein